MPPQGRKQESVSDTSNQLNLRVACGLGSLACLDSLTAALQRETPWWNSDLAACYSEGDPMDGYARARQLIEATGYPVEEYDETTFRGRVLMGTGLGVATEQGEILIRADLDGRDKLLTLIHEYSHHIMHVGHDLPPGVGRIRHCECEAVGTTYIVASYLGIQQPTETESELVAAAMGDTALVEEALVNRAGAIVHAARIIVRTLAGALPPDPEAS